MIPDKQGRMIDIHHRDGSFELSPFERDAIYQQFLREFPDPGWRRGILKEHRVDEAHRRAMEWFHRQADRLDGRVRSDRIYNFVSQAVATEAGVLPAAERWDWWVGCSIAK